MLIENEDEEDRNFKIKVNKNIDLDNAIDLNDYNKSIFTIIQRIMKKEQYLILCKYEIIKQNIKKIKEIQNNTNEYKRVYNLIFGEIKEKFISELKQSRDLVCFAKILFYTFLTSKDNKNKIFKQNIKNVKIIEYYLDKNKKENFEIYVDSNVEKLKLFNSGMSVEDLNNLRKNFDKMFYPENDDISDVNKSKNFEENILFFQNLNKYISFNILKNPDNYLNIDEIAKDYKNLNKNINSQETGIFYLSLLAKFYKVFGIEIYITKDKDDNLKGIEWASLQYLFSFGGIKKYVLHFDYGEEINNKILNDKNEQTNLLSKWREKISNTLETDINNIILTNIHRGSVAVDCIFINQKIIYEKLKEKLIDLPDLKRIEEKPLIEKLQLNSDIFDILGDRPEGFWCVESGGETRGGKDYIPPLDNWNGLGLSVADKYDQGDNDWLGYEHEEGEFAIGYMGINKLLEEEFDYNIDSVCIFQDPDSAEKNAAVIDIVGYKIKLILMCRVNPDKIRILNNKENQWVLNPNSNEIRPYRILIKKIESPKEDNIILALIPVNYINEAINSRNNSFFEFYHNDEYKRFCEINGMQIEKELFVIRLYTNIEPLYYKYLNDYLRQEKIDYFTKDELKSLTYCLHSALEKQNNVENGTTVYRGVSLKFPSEIQINTTFYFREFVSTSTNEDVARIFAYRGSFFIIKIENNGINGFPNYCFNTNGISMNEDEEEILISSHCSFRLTGKERKIAPDGIEYDEIYLTCEGFIKDLLVN